MLSTILRSSTSSLNSLGWSGSALLSSLAPKSMRPVGTQSCFTIPLNSLLVTLLPVARLVISASGFAIAHSFTSNQDHHKRITHCNQCLSPYPISSWTNARRLHGTHALSLGRDLALY